MYNEIPHLSHSDDGLSTVCWKGVINEKTLRSKTNGVDRIGDCDLPVNRQVVSEGHGKKGVSNHVRMRDVTLILFLF